MGKGSRFSRTGRIKAGTPEEREKEKKKKKKELDFRDGAKLPWQGVVMVLGGGIFLIVGALFLLAEVNRPGPLVWNMIAGVVGLLLGFGLLFFPFGKWANL